MDAFDDFGGDHEDEDLVKEVEQEVIHQNVVNERQFHFTGYEEFQG